MSELFTTQSANFLSALSGAVDPRTGMYGYNLAIAHLNGNAGMGPDLPIILNYSPLNTRNSGFGIGVTLPLSRYDKGTRTLQLSTGERYRTHEAGGKLNILHAKPLNVRAEIRDDGYWLFYKNGTVERLTAPSLGGNIKVTELIQSPAGRMLNLKWENHGNDKRLLSVSDASCVLLNVKYTAANITFRVWPDTSEAYEVELKLQNNQLISVTNHRLSPALTWALGYSRGRLTTVTSPTGLTDRVTYSQNGHRFPTGGPAGNVPYVTAYRQTGADGALIQNLRYQFSNKNFLGYGGSNQASWSSDADFLYGVLGGYEYSSTEIAQDEKGTELSRITRTYNNYHLQTKELSMMVGTPCHTLTETDYHAIAGKNFDDQPAQFQLPAKHTVTLTDISKPESEQRRTEVTITEYDQQGNPLRQESPDGTVTEYEYYPADGDGDNCPPEPHGFVRFLKKQTITPRRSDYHDTPHTITELAYGVLGNTDCVVQTSSRQYAGTQLLSVRKTDYNHDSSSPEFGRITSMTDTVHAEDQTFTTQQLFTTTRNEGMLTQTVTTTGHDGLTTTHRRSHSMFSGLLLSETDAQNVTVNYAYDPLGRLLSQTIAPETDYEHTVRWEYAIEKTGPVTVQTDASGNRLKTRFDSAGREISLQQWDVDSTHAFYEVASRSYDLLGRVQSADKHDWTTASTEVDAFSLQMTVSHDAWGAPQVCAFSDLTQYHQEEDPVLLTRNTYIQSQGSRHRERSGTQTTALDVRSQLPKTDTLLDKAGQIQGVRSYDWDGLGRLRQETDELGQTTGRTYDVYGRILTQTLPDGSIMSRTYAPHLTGEQVASIRMTGLDAEGQTQTWLLGNQEFDSLGRVTKSTSFGRTTLYCYDGVSPLPSAVTLPSGKTLTYRYIPELGNVVSSLTAEGVTQTFSYDNHTANVLMAQEGDTQNTNVWSPAGKLTEETFTQSGTLCRASSTYTLKGDLVTYTDITGKQTGYEQDALGRVIAITDDALTVKLEYDALGRLQKQIATSGVTPSSLTTTLGYDDFGREISRTIADSSGTMLKVLQTWRLNGLLDTCVTEQNGIPIREEQYGYDVRNRLVSYMVTGSSLPQDAYSHEMVAQTYQYDALNNLTRVSTTLADGSNDAVTYHYKNADDPTQLTWVTHTHGDYPQCIVLEYDAEGRMTRDEAGRTLSYDVTGRLVGVSGEGIRGGGYGYDAFNRLVSQNVSDAETRQLYYRGGELVNEVLAQHNREIRLLKSGHTCLGVSDGDGLMLTVGDQNDSLLWSHQGDKQEGKPHVWDPWGNGNTTDGLPGFNGERADPVSGTYHLGNGYRAYNPVLMRFNCPDNLSPFGAGGINPYAYCAGDPVNHTDPSGYISWQGIVGIVSGIIGLGLSVFTAGASIAAAGGIAAAVSSASTTTLVVGSLGVLADVTAIASGTMEDIDPAASSTLGWVSMATGLAGMAVVPGMRHSASLKAKHKRAAAFDNKMRNKVPPEFQDRYDYLRNKGWKPKEAYDRAYPSWARRAEAQQSAERNNSRQNTSFHTSNAGEQQHSSHSRSSRGTSEPRNPVTAPSPPSANRALDGYPLIKKILENPKNPRAVFPNKVNYHDFKQLTKQIHPDKHREITDEANKAFKIFYNWKNDLVI